MIQILVMIPFLFKQNHLFFFILLPHLNPQSSFRIKCRIVSRPDNLAFNLTIWKIHRLMYLHPGGSNTNRSEDKKVKPPCLGPVVFQLKYSSLRSLTDLMVTTIRGLLKATSRSAYRNMSSVSPSLIKIEFINLEIQCQSY